MMLRFTATIMLFLILGCSGIGNDGGTPSTPPTQVVSVQTDLDTLRRQVRLPNSATSCQFRRGIMGRAGGLGPTDYKLVAWVALSSMEGLDARYGAPGKTRGPTSLNPEDAALLPPEVRAALPSGPEGAVLLAGVVRRPKHRGGMSITRVIEVEDQGIFIWAMTR